MISDSFASAGTILKILSSCQFIGKEFLGTAKVFGGRGSSRRSLVAGQPLIATTQWLAILRVKACTAFRFPHASATNRRTESR